VEKWRQNSKYIILAPKIKIFEFGAKNYFGAKIQIISFWRKKLTFLVLRNNVPE
jgi:hypothetical protein